PRAGARDRQARTGFRRRRPAAISGPPLGPGGGRVDKGGMGHGHKAATATLVSVALACGAPAPARASGSGGSAATPQGTAGTGAIQAPSVPLSGGSEYGVVAAPATVQRPLVG